MMNKNNKTERLFSYIGEIDDKLLEEAISYKRVQRNGFNFGMLAACLALIFVIAVALPTLRRFEELGGNQISGEKEELSPEKPYVALDALFVDSYGGAYERLDSLDELSYVGDASLVWQFGDSGEIYSKKLTQSELENITKHLGDGEEVGDSSPQISCRVWILDGNGRVVSPYLKESKGNEGCEIFDYEPEIIPNDELVSCISDVLN